MDVMGEVYLADGTKLSVVTGIDDHSRFCVCARFRGHRRRDRGRADPLEEEWVEDPAELRGESMPVLRLSYRAHRDAEEERRTRPATGRKPAIQQRMTLPVHT